MKNMEGCGTNHWNMEEKSYIFNDLPSMITASLSMKSQQSYVCENFTDEEIDLKVQGSGLHYLALLKLFIRR